jgi:hypothetical protein
MTAPKVVGEAEPIGGRALGLLRVIEDQPHIVRVTIATGPAPQTDFLFDLRQLVELAPRYRHIAHVSVKTSRWHRNRPDK